jgi:hypothetical protein
MARTQKSQIQKFLTLFLLLASSAAAAQNIDTVTVTAPSLAGTWKIVGPPPQRLGDVQPKLHCRIDIFHEKPALSCFERKDGSVTVKGGDLRIIWSPTLAQSNVIEVHMTSADSFTGVERVLMMGIPMYPVTRTGTREELDPGTPDAARKAPLLRAILEEMENGTFNRPYDGTLVELPKVGELQTLGVVTAITYMDETNARRGDKSVPHFFSLYAVDFQNGRRFCVLHQRDDGVLDAFKCV